MRIPLDYYQILGVSFDATPEQIQQSYEDRLQQLPKQQYSAAAIASRKKLIQEANSILLNPKRRQEHDQRLFPELDGLYEEQSESEQQSIVAGKGVDIDFALLAGALILLLEFGEFDAVRQLGISHLNRPIDLKKMPNDVGPVDDDVALAVSIANLELGREYWQQGECEDAGQCLQTGLKILQDEGKFLDIQAEIETDLSKLRPYLVLDLLALDETDPKRAEGLSLLQDMLDERGGMEGSGDDQSGLPVNDFLLFMQQLRDNLTVDEQFNLFRAESMRPSSVATYLSVYAHVARGVSENAPSLISHAKSLLGDLADRQDLSLEQGMCSLLLGQPDAAARCVQDSSDEEAIAFIQDYSKGAPDIIPGLYLYTEQWLQQEVYPYFRDLRGQTISLETYFNDEGVQHQLSELEPDLPNFESNWESNEVDPKWERWLSETTQSEGTEDLAQSSKGFNSTQESQPILQNATDQKDHEKNPSNWFAALTSKTNSKSEEQTREEEIADLSWGQALPSNLSNETQTLKPDVPASKASTPKKKKKKPTTQPSSPTNIGGEKEVVSTNNAPQSESEKKPWALWGASLLLGIAVLWGALAIGRLFQSPSTKSEAPNSDPNTTIPNNPAASPEGTQPSEAETPKPNPPENKSETNSGKLTQDAAKEIVQAWQKIKSESLGKSHQIEPLKQILVEPALSRWTYSADISKDEGKYTTYELKQLDILSVSMDSPTEARVTAKIKETRDQYFTGADKPYASLTDDTYQVKYRLESIDGKWRIKEMDLID